MHWLYRWETKVQKLAGSILSRICNWGRLFIYLFMLAFRNYFSPLKFIEDVDKYNAVD